VVGGGSGAAVKCAVLVGIWVVMQARIEAHIACGNFVKCGVVNCSSAAGFVLWLHGCNRKFWFINRSLLLCTSIYAQPHKLQHRSAQHCEHRVIYHAQNDHTFSTVTLSPSLVFVLIPILCPYMRHAVEIFSMYCAPRPPPFVQPRCTLSDTDHPTPQPSGATSTTAHLYSSSIFTTLHAHACAHIQLFIHTPARPAPRSAFVS
jgi:hypothetical protein